MKYDCEINYLCCCGVREIGNFTDDGWVSVRNTQNDEIGGNSFKELLEKINEGHKGYVLHIWFVKYKNFDGKFKRNYEWQGLRRLVRQIPGVVHIAETINPNSGNKIDGYSWVAK